MIDPTAPTPLDDPPAWQDADSADLRFASRAAGYLGEQGLDHQAIVTALRTELGLSTTDAIGLAGRHLSPSQPSSPRRGHSPTTPTNPNVQLITT